MSKMTGLYIGIHLDLSDPKWLEVLNKARSEYDEVVDIRLLHEGKTYDFKFDEFIEKVIK